MKRLLLFGGAFNPPHKGHERLLRAAAKAVDPDVIVVLPTAASPHKQGAEVSFSHRVNMARVFKKIERVTISGLEGRGRKRRNYTIQSLKRIKKKYPEFDIFLLIGGDMTESFFTWSRYRRIIAMATLVVAARETDDGGLKKTIARMENDGARIELLRLEAFAVSSSELRGMLRKNKDVSEFIFDETLNYIKEHSLYAEPSGEGLTAGVAGKDRR